MAVVPGYDYDMFVSYAHLDDQPPASNLQGWVKILVHKLEIEVRQRGFKNFEVWSDERLAENLPLTPQLMEKIKRSAMLLVVMSPSYLQSEWCGRERDGFLSLVKDRVAEGCVFVLEARQVREVEYPATFRDLVPVKFWMADPESQTDRPLGVPNPDEVQYVTRIQKLSHLIKAQLDQLAKGPAAPHVTSVPAAELATVFVARATEDLEDQEDELRNYLGQLGITVLPQTRYPQNDSQAYEKAMLDDLSTCKIYAQLLSNSRGRELDFAPCKRYPCFQHEIAKKSQKPRLLWRDRSLDMAAVKDPDHRSLLEAAQASTLEDFKRAVADEARKPPPPPPRPSLNVMVFVSADGGDRNLARQVGKELALRGVECFYPLESGTPDEVRKDMENVLQNCDGVLLIYGSAGPEWVRFQYLINRKMGAQRDHPLRTLAVFQGPPPEKIDIGADIPNLRILDCRNGLDSSKLDEFARALQQ
jgi:hypothetical protein